MPTKPVFNLRAGDKIIATKYDRLLYTRGHRAHARAAEVQSEGAVA